MKILVVYFSFSGNNRVLAEYLAERLDGDVCPVVEKKKRSTGTILLDMLFRRMPKLEPPRYPLANYNHVVLAAPVWNAKLANPMKSLIKNERDALESYSFITLCGYERPGQRQSLQSELTALAGHSPKALAELKISELFPPEQRKDVKVISGYRATRDDLKNFEPQIDAFVQMINRL